MSDKGFWIELTKRLTPVIVIACFGWFQGPNPQNPDPWWQLTEDKIPYIVILLVAVITFILGGLVRPIVDNLGNALLQWIKGWGKHGKFRKRYLTDMISRNRHLALLPANVVAARWDYRRRAVELEELYTPLSLGDEQKTFDADETLQLRQMQTIERRNKSPRNRWQAIWWKIRPPIDPSAGELGKIIQTYPRLIVRGDPGSGKTTLLRYLAITCARSLRNDQSDSDNRRMIHFRLGWHKQHLPLIVNLGSFTDIVNWPKEKRLLDAIVTTLPGELRARYPKGFFEKQLEKGNCLVMLDGFDELGSRTARNRMARLIDDFVNTYNHSENRFIVSTRIVGYEGQLDASGFAIRTVQDLNGPAVRDLVKRRYKAIAIGEGLGRSEQEQKDLEGKYNERAEALLSELQHNEGLQRLITNPLLLSLIVLVSLVQVRLPEQRHLLYRDCVEILTERWQIYRQEIAGSDRVKAGPADGLTLEQKLTLLRRLAFTLQNRREQGASQVLLPRSEACEIIAVMLPDFIAAHLPEDETQQKREAQRRAIELLDNIRAESGILVEKGLDECTGEPVVGFSHLTFQEYLAADAIHHRNEKLPVLLENLFNPDWREVLLLYVSLEDGGRVISACLEDTREPFITRYMLAGRCLAEDGPLDARLQRCVLAGLQAYFYPEREELRRVQELFKRFGSRQRYDWLLGNIKEFLTDSEQAIFATDPQTSEATHLNKYRQQVMLRIAQTPNLSPTERAEVADTLDGLGYLPSDLHSFAEISFPPSSFRMGRYPVTNAQYQRFLEADDFAKEAYWLNFPKFSEPDKKTGEITRIGYWGDEGWRWLQRNLDENRKLYPRYWNDPRFGIVRAGVPVVGITWYEANAYCHWLLAHWDELPEVDQNPGWKPEMLRLPTEAEWIAAAGGADPRERFPWDQAGEITQDEAEILRRANVSESGLGRTTPVGMYPLGVSPHGIWDLSGNVWEWQANYQEQKGNWIALRGGAWDFDSYFARLSERSGIGPSSRWDSRGFRLVAPPSE